MDWRDEHDALLRKLCSQEEKLSAPQIAKAISEAFNIVPALTRASIIGRARRKKIALPRQRNGWTQGSAGQGKWAMREPPKPKPVSLWRPARPTLVYDADTINPRPPVEAGRQSKRGTILPEPEDEPGIYLLNAADRDCRWPISEPSAYMRVCGEPAQDGSRYCVHCHAFAYTSVPVGGGIFSLPVNTQRGLK